MKKFHFCLLSIFFLLFAATNSNAANKFEHYVFQYQSGDVYDVKFASNTITWKGLKGDDKGKSETDVIKRKNIAKNLEVIQWSEKDGTFVTIAFNRQSLKVISSIKSSHGNWLLSGTAI